MVQKKKSWPMHWPQSVIVVWFLHRAYCPVSPVIHERHGSAQVGQHGWEMCPWSEEALASKKIFPPYAVRVSARGWSQRLRVTMESVVLMVQHVHMDHLKQPKLLRKKATKRRMEECAVEAAFASAIANELLPMDQALHRQWLGLYTSCDTKALLELQLALAETDEMFMASDLPTIRELMEPHVFGGLRAVSLTTPDQAAKDLVVRQMQDDLQAFQVWKGKMSDHESKEVTVEHFWRSFVCLSTLEEQPEQAYAAFKCTMQVQPAVVAPQAWGS